MLPLSLLKVAEDQPMLIELKNGDTYNGRLVGCNAFMNICLKDVICTSKNGDKFWKMPECYIRGNTIKYLRIPDEIIHQVAEDENQQRRLAMRNNAPRGGGRTSGGRFGRGDNAGRGRGSEESTGGAAGGTASASTGTGGRGGYGGRGAGGRGGGYQNNYNNSNSSNSNNNAGGRGGYAGRGGQSGGRGGDGYRGGGGRGAGGREGGGRSSNRPTST